MTQLGGKALFAQGAEFMVGSRETPEDAARVLSRYVDAIVDPHARSRTARAFCRRRRPCR